MSSSIEASSSSLAALSAQQSLKRSRVLYDVNPQTTFLPGVDPTILQASINRRKRRVQPQQQQQQRYQQEQGQTNALALVSEGMKPLPASSNVNNNNASSKALIRAGDATEKPTGILVVRFWDATRIVIVCLFLTLSLFCFTVEIEIELQDENPHSDLARSLEIGHCLVVALGLGQKHCHGPYQRNVCDRIR
jgi:hypothetical protein